MAAIQSFSFENSNLRVIDNQWFVAKDVCDALEIKNHRQALRNLKEKLENAGIPAVISNDIRLNTGGQFRKVTVVNESGVNLLITNSRKAEAVRLQWWIASEVLPSIRKTGQYNNHSFAVNTIALAHNALYVHDLWKKHLRPVLEATNKRMHAKSHDRFNDMGFCAHMAIKDASAMIGEAPFDTRQLQFYNWEK